MQFTDSTSAAPPALADLVLPPDPRPAEPRGNLVYPAAGESRTRSRLYFVVAAIVIALFFLTTHALWVPACSGVDQNGYLVGGKMIADHGSTRFTPQKPGTRDPDPLQFVGNMWLGVDFGTPQERYYPKYPIGLPLLTAILLKTLGLATGAVAAYYISPVGMTLALLALFLLFRRIVGSFWAVLGMILMATSPVTLDLANNPNSHGSTLFFVCSGMFMLFNWWEKGSWWRAVLAGFLLGYALTIRYTEGLLLLPMGLVILFSLLGGRWRKLKPWLEAGAMLLGWAVPVGILLLHNRIGFHHWTGYDVFHESSGESFKWEQFCSNWDNMLRQLNDVGLFFIFPLGVLGLSLMFWRIPKIAGVLWAWFLPATLLYTSYYWAPNADTPMDANNVSYLRFFLTVLPPMTLGAIWLLQQGLGALDVQSRQQRVGNHRPAVRLIVAACLFWAAIAGMVVLHLADSPAPLIGMTAALAGVLIASLFGRAVALAGLVVAFAAGVGAAAASQTMVLFYAQCTATQMAAENTLRFVQPGSVIFANEKLLNHLQFVGDYTLYSGEIFGRIRMRQPPGGDPNQPFPFQRERAEAINKLFDGDSTKLAYAERKIIADAIHQDRHVYIIIPGRDTFARSGGPLDSIYSRHDGYKFIIDEAHPLATWSSADLAKTLTPPPRRQMFGMFQRGPGGRRFGQNVNEEAADWKLVEVKLPAAPLSSR